MRLLFYTLFSLLLIFPIGAAENDLQSKRFTRWTHVLSQALDTENLDEAADNLVRGLSRLAAFNLQALGRVYQHVDKDYFKKSIRNEFKLMEDSIGEFKKWRDLLENAEDQGASPEKIKRFKEKKETAKVELKYLLTGDKDIMKDYADLFSGSKKEKLEKRFKKYRKKVERRTEDSEFSQNLWAPENEEDLSKLQAVEASIRSRDWGSYEEDRNNAIDGLIRQLKAVRDNETYSFDVLENETAGVEGRTKDKSGIHEFRREVRWFNMEAGSLGGLVAIEDDKVQVVKDVIADGGTQEQINEAAAPLQASCPVDAFKKYVTEKKMIKNKYTQLPPNSAERVCTISTCLYYAMAKIVSQVGKVKDYVEEQHSLSDNGVIQCRDGSVEDYTPEKYDGHWNNVPSCIEEEVQASYDYNIKNNKLMEHLIEQLETCKSQ